MTERIKIVYKQSRKTYGSPHIYEHLRQECYTYGENRVCRLMKSHSIRAKQKRWFRITTNSKNSNPVAENQLNLEFHAPTPNRSWLSDITYVQTGEGRLYLSCDGIGGL